ncbi:MAG: aminoglycoside phosphotransferase family protein [Chloroflexota bacterium]
MNHVDPPTESQPIIKGTRPWAFTVSELTASLRRYTGDPNLSITKIDEEHLQRRRPSIGRIRGLIVTCSGSTGEYEFNLVVKEPQGSTRTGTAGAGLREVSIYKSLGEQLPVCIPELLASHPGGGWLVMLQLPEGRRSELWSAADYLMATDQLVALHDRFWGLGEDLAYYSWLSRPLDSDFSIYVRAAENSVENLKKPMTPNMLSENSELMQLLNHILGHMDEINAELHKSPATLLHGDYFPGNINVHSDGSLTVYDWEEASIGPAIVDLITFVNTSRWWFEPLPVEPEKLIEHYREKLFQTNGFTWEDAQWEIESDFAIMWVFIAEWVDLLAAIPDSMLIERLPQLDAVWLNPVKEAAERRLR